MSVTDSTNPPEVTPPAGAVLIDEAQGPLNPSDRAFWIGLTTVGLSILSGAHMTLFPQILAKLREKGCGDLPVFGGGIIPKDDIAELKKLGIAEIFTPGASTKDIVTWIRTNIAPRS